MNFLIICALKTLKPIRPPKSRPTIKSMITIRLIIAWVSSQTARHIPHMCSVGLVVAGATRLGATVPPSATQGLKQGGRIGIARGLGLDQVDARLGILLLGIEQRQVAHGTEFELTPRQFERLARDC